MDKMFPKSQLYWSSRVRVFPHPNTHPYNFTPSSFSSDGYSQWVVKETLIITLLATPGLGFLQKIHDLESAKQLKDTHGFPMS